LALILTLVGTVFSAQILRWMGGEANVVKIGTPFMQIISLGSIFLTLNITFSGLMIGMGKTKTNLYILGTININIISQCFVPYGHNDVREVDHCIAPLHMLCNAGIANITADKTKLFRAEEWFFHIQAADLLYGWVGIE